MFALQMNGLSEWFEGNPWLAWPVATLLVALYEIIIIRYFFRKSIRSVIAYIRAFIGEEFNLKYLLGIVVLATAGIMVFYGHPYLKQTRSELYGEPAIFLYYFLLYLFPFSVGYLLYPVFGIKAPFLKDYRFWSLMVVAVLIFALRSSGSLLTETLWQRYESSGNPSYWTRVMSLVLYRAPAIYVLVFIAWLIMDRRSMPFYGFTRKNFDLRPYFGMLCFMIPLVLMASLTGDFLNSYPRAKGWGLEQYSIYETADLKYFGLFELVYGLDFINIELYFRGFLILAFLRFGGPKVILPAAVFYVYIHFGKPLGETISSFFGGTLLGIIAYYSRSILGGIIIHMGIAWLMEAAAFVSLLYL